MPFEKNFFINCPFDKDYHNLLRPLIFTILYFDLEPKISQTRSSSNIRIDEIKKMIRESKYAIHDLSRSRYSENNDLPRLNMAYELGLDIGCAEYGNKKLKEKRILILESEKYHYQKVISDIAGQDISSHNNNPKLLVKIVRDWFSTMDEYRVYPSPNEIWNDYQKFANILEKQLYLFNFSPKDVDELPINDFIKTAKQWFATNKALPY
ncbi:MAG: hypothetical protein WCF67_14720 [Chitinophagaceae bacterium]